MTIKITCPKCGEPFSIELLAADLEIARLRRVNADLTAKVAAMEAMKKTAPLGAGLDAFFGGMK